MPAVGQEELGMSENNLVLDLIVGGHDNYIEEDNFYESNTDGEDDEVIK